MTFLGHVNRRICETISHHDDFISFGQNIGAGSHLSGLTRNLPQDDRHLVINMPNCENGLVGFGFGLMLEGRNSAFFCKQLDFLLLGLDQFVNTYNMVRLRPAQASFTVVCIVVDSGFEGPQSRLNNLTDFSSIADLPAFAISNGPDADAVIGRHLIAPGFRIIAVSQRLFRTEALPPSDQFADVSVGADAHILRHAAGTDATVVSFNLSYPQAAELHQQLGERGITASFFSVAASRVLDWDPIIADVRRTGRLVVVDDSRSRNRPADRLRAALADAGVNCPTVPLYRPIVETDIRPNADVFSIDVEGVHRALR